MLIRQQRERERAARDAANAQAARLEAALPQTQGVRRGGGAACLPACLALFLFIHAVPTL
jgi:hypothetical protein